MAALRRAIIGGWLLPALVSRLDESTGSDVTPTRKDIGRSESEWALMARCVVALFWKSANVQPLIDADHARELLRNIQLRAASSDVQERHRSEYATTLAQRLRLLRRSVFGSFFILASAVALSVLGTYVFAPLSTGQRAALGAASIFSFAWATVARLGWPGQSWKGDTVVERLDERIFKFLYWLGTLLGILAVL